MKPLVPVMMLAACSALLVAQERRRVPDDSVRVTMSGCANGYVFTTGRRTVEEPGNIDVPEGLHIRMNGPKKVMSDIKAHQRSRIEITGIMKKEDFRPVGVGLGGGVRIEPGSNATAGGRSTSPAAGQLQIDVEQWRQVSGGCY